MGITPLMITAVTKPYNADRMHFLITKGIDINARDQNGHTALILTTVYDNVDAAETLLSTPDINIEAKDITGSTALMKAVIYKSKAVCEKLIQAGANLNASNYT